MNSPSKKRNDSTISVASSTMNQGVRYPMTLYQKKELMDKMLEGIDNLDLDSY